jgi:predicted DNA binding CopG/RHH family protein
MSTMPERNKKEARITVRLPQELLDRIMGMAQDQDRPLANMIRVLLERGLEVSTDD